MSYPLVPHTVGLAVGSMFGIFHFCWALMIAIGVAQPLMDFIFTLHMVRPPYTVMPFSITTALGLLIFTCIVGYLCGYVLSYVWNAFHKNTA